MFECYENFCVLQAGRLPEVLVFYTHTHTHTHTLKAC